MNDNEYAVLLAVGADGVQDGALDFAAAEADRRGTGVELLHVVHALVTPPDVEHVDAVDRVMSKVAREVLTDAADRMRERLGDGARVSTQLLSGPIATTIAERAAATELAVLERRDVGPIERLLTMSVSSRVGAHARVPVVVVPRGWTSAGRDDLPVIVGVDDPQNALRQVEAAADYARAAHRPLVALHAMWLAEPYQEAVSSGVGQQAWLQNGTTELEKSVAKLRGLDDLDLRTDVRWARPADALVEATRTSSVLVLSRRDPGRLSGSHLGPVTRAVLQHADGPVLLVDRS